MQNVNLEYGGDEGMQIVEEHVDEINEEHGCDEEMTNVKKTMGSVDIEPMIGEKINFDIYVDNFYLNIIYINLYICIYLI